MGRGELLRWLNTTLNLKLSKVEQICTGAVPCQLMDALHPGIVPMHKVKCFFFSTPSPSTTASATTRSSRRSSTSSRYKR